MVEGQETQHGDSKRPWRLSGMWSVTFNGHDRWHPAVATSQIERAQASSDMRRMRHAISGLKTVPNCESSYFQSF